MQSKYKPIREITKEDTDEEEAFKDLNDDGDESEESQNCYTLSSKEEQAKDDWSEWYFKSEDE